jgi:hypothetical protein
MVLTQAPEPGEQADEEHGDRGENGQCLQVTESLLNGLIEGFLIDFQCLPERIVEAAVGPVSISHRRLLQICCF